jgi:hypothetical protein
MAQECEQKDTKSPTKQRDLTNPGAFNDHICFGCLALRVCARKFTHPIGRFFDALKTKTPKRILSLEDRG